MKKIHLGGKYGSVIGNYALVDDADYDWLNQWKWTAIKSGKTFYASRGFWVDRKIVGVKMHRQILGIEDQDDICDHADTNGLNNQRSNLRKCTRLENSMNRNPYEGRTSKYKGVHYDKESKKWRASIRLNGKLSNIGRFTTQEAAAKAYDEYAARMFGDFAVLNSI